jgi:hypothetical protein
MSTHESFQYFDRAMASRCRREAWFALARARDARSWARKDEMAAQLRCALHYRRCAHGIAAALRRDAALRQQVQS